MRIPDARSGILLNTVNRLKRRLQIGEVGNVDAVIDLSPKAMDMLAALYSDGPKKAKADESSDPAPSKHSMRTQFYA